MSSVIDTSKAKPVKDLSAPTGDWALAQAIERAARDQSVDIEKMERLLAMHERIHMRTAETAFNASMSEAQTGMSRVSTDAVNPQTYSKYASYAQLDRALRPIYTAHGFAISYSEADSPKPEHVRVVAHLSHRGGFSREFHLDMPADGKGAKGGDVMTKTHATGAAMTYGMRYLLKGIFNVAIGEDDNDGNQQLETINEKQVADLRALLTEVKADIPAFLRWAKVSALEQIPTRAYSTCVQMAEAKRRVLLR